MRMKQTLMTYSLSLFLTEIDATLCTKTLFLLYQLAVQCPEEHLPKVRQLAFTNAIVPLLSQQLDNEDVVEKVITSHIYIYPLC
jgi:hypothetical protein